MVSRAILNNWPLVPPSGTSKGDLVDMPIAAFSFLSSVFGVNVYKNNGLFVHDYDDQKSKPAITGSTYYVKPGGSDAAAGTSPATAFATLSRAMNRIINDGVSQALVGKIVIDTSAGDIIYSGSTQGLYGVTCRKSVVIEPSGPGRVICANTVANTASFTWTVTANPPIYSTPCPSAPGYVVDLSRIVAGSPANKREYEPLALGASATTLTAGQYFYDSGTTTLYVRTADGRAPDNKIIPTAIGTGSFAFGPQLSGQVFWAKGIDFVGGYNTQIDYTFMPDNTGKAYFNECTSQATGLDGFVMNMMGYGLFSKCGAYNTTGDGFSAYAGAAGNTLNQSWKAELDCRARRNGNSGNLANNASTGHDASRTVVVNPDYDLSQDRLVHYVYASLAWIVGGILGRSARASGATSRTLMVNQGASGRVPTIWLDGVTYSGHSEIDVEATSYGQILFKGSTPAGLTTTTSANGVIGTY
ncbi:MULTISPECIES: hypothetical protein [Agrobacterium]|uniref:hypothetical protein n=1 Tax=Agrobacterium tumefaciens TaxID=358 RepID=UPI001573A82C|nr:hypothetical protein [Agrobacterium tumefaciens]